jgi:hypothetical protein
MKTPDHLKHIGKINNIDCYDSKDEESLTSFQKRFPDLPVSEYERILQEGLEKIEKQFKNVPDQYSIESKSKHVQILFLLRYNHDEESKEYKDGIRTVQGFPIYTQHVQDHPFYLNDNPELIAYKSKHVIIDIIKAETKKTNTYATYYEKDSFFIHSFVSGEYSTSFEIVEVK